MMASILNLDFKYYSHSAFDNISRSGEKYKAIHGSPHPRDKERIQFWSTKCLRRLDQVYEKEIFSKTNIDRIFIDGSVIRVNTGLIIAFKPKNSQLDIQSKKIIIGEYDIWI